MIDTTVISTRFWKRTLKGWEDVDVVLASGEERMLIEKGEIETFEVKEVIKTLSENEALEKVERNEAWRARLTALCSELVGA